MQRGAFGTLPQDTPGDCAAAGAERCAEAVIALADAQPRFDPAGLRLSGMLGAITGLDLPKRVGGGEWPATAMAQLFRLVGRRDAELRDAIGAGHARLLALARSRRFDPLLHDVVAGKAFCAVAITEPDAGSDLHGLRATATPTAGGYRIDGVKQHVSRLAECTHAIVYAAIPADIPRISAFLVPITASGLKVEAMSPLGMGALSWGRLRLDGVVVAVDQRIGGEGEGVSLFQRHFSYWRVMMAAIAIGCAEDAVDAACAHLKSREAVGGPIGRFTHLQLGLAQTAGDLRMGWLLIEDVAKRIDGRESAVAEAAMAKAEGVERAYRAVEWAMGIFGAAGYDAATGVEKRLRDLAGLRIADGTGDLLRGQVARAILGERLYAASLGREAPVGPNADEPRKRFW
jgi:alkylation response protein AidB-like acyl-CoA dehydrogenase